MQALQLLERHLMLFRESLETTGNLVNEVGADGVRQMILRKLALLSARATENDNADREVGRGTDDASVGLEDLSAADQIAPAVSG